MSEQSKDYFSTREAAELLGVAVSTVQLWTNNGSLQAWTTAGGHRRIVKSSVDNMLKQQASKQQKSIVVVEDNEQDIMLYKKQFEYWDINADVHILKDGYAGLMNIGRIAPDIIITDLMMPNMNGFEMLKAIKQNPDMQHCKLIAVSALTADEIKNRGDLPEDVMVFQKPVPFYDLERLVREVITSHVT